MIVLASACARGCSLPDASSVYSPTTLAGLNRYGAIDNSGGFYTAPVDKDCRSRMNAPFRINGGDEKLEGEFVKEAVSGVV